MWEIKNNVWSGVANCFMHSQECHYLGVNFLSCKATREINTQTTLAWDEHENWYLTCFVSILISVIFITCRVRNSHIGHRTANMSWRTCIVVKQIQSIILVRLQICKWAHSFTVCRYEKNMLSLFLLLLFYGYFDWVTIFQFSPLSAPKSSSNIKKKIEYWRLILH